MRYAQFENPIAAGVLPTGRAVTVRVLSQESNTVLTLASNVAIESVLGGVYQFALSNISTSILGFAQLVVEFKANTGETDYCKIVVRGYVDEVTRTRKLVGALL
jgi:hypothetical protein